MVQRATRAPRPSRIERLSIVWMFIRIRPNESRVLPFSRNSRCLPPSPIRHKPANGRSELIRPFEIKKHFSKPVLQCQPMANWHHSLRLWFTGCQRWGWQVRRLARRQSAIVSQYPPQAVSTIEQPRRFSPRPPIGRSLARGLPRLQPMFPLVPIKHPARTVKPLISIPSHPPDRTRLNRQPGGSHSLPAPATIHPSFVKICLSVLT